MVISLGAVARMFPAPEASAIRAAFPAEARVDLVRVGSVAIMQHADAQLDEMTADVAVTSGHRRWPVVTLHRALIDPGLPSLQRPRVSIPAHAAASLAAVAYCLIQLWADAVGGS